MDLADKILQQAKQEEQNNALADKLLGNAQVQPEQAQPEKPKGIYGDIPFLPKPDSWEDVLIKAGVDPKSPTAADDYLINITPIKQKERVVTGIGAGMMLRAYGLKQLGLEIQMQGTAVANMLTGQMTSEKGKQRYLKAQKELADFTNKKEEEFRFYKQTPIGKSTAGKVGEVVGEIAPFMAIPPPARTLSAIPGLGAAKHLSGMVGESTAYGALEGATRFIPEGQSRGEAATSGAAYGLGAGLALKGVTSGVNTLRGGGFIHLTPTQKRLAAEVQKGREAGLDLEPIRLDQQLFDHPLAARFGSQAESTSASVRQQAIAQRESAITAISNVETAINLSQEKAGKVMMEEAKRGLKALQNEIMNRAGRTTNRQAGNALNEALAKDFVEKSRARVSSFYQNVDAAAAKENPVFDITKTQQVAKDVMAGIESVGESSLTSIGVPVGGLRKVISDLNALHPHQYNYQSLNQIRQELGTILEGWPWQMNSQKGQAKRLYAALTDNMMNPANRAPQYQKAIQKANAEAKARFEILDDSEVRRAIQQGNEYKLADNFGNPGGMSQGMMDALAQSDKVKLDTFRDLVRLKILTNENGANKAIEEWATKDPEGFKFLFRTKKEMYDIQKMADQMDRLRRGPLAELANIALEQQSRARVALKLLTSERASPSDIDLYMQSIGGKNSRGHKATIAAIYDDIISRAETDVKGIKTIDKAKLDDVISAYKNSGVWDRVLRPQDRDRLIGLRAYMDLVMRSGKDVGASLEAAQAITNLKHPSTFLAGAHQIAANTILGKILMNDKFAKFVIGDGGTKWIKMNETERLGAIISAYKNSLLEE